MSRFRFSMTSAMLAIALFAVTFAGRRPDAAIWTRILFMAVFFALVLSIVCVVYSSGLSRVFWLGFALLGWAFFLSQYFMPGLHTNGYECFPAYEIASTLHPKLQTQTTTNMLATAPGMGMPGMPPSMSMMMAGGPPGAGLEQLG